MAILIVQQNVLSSSLENAVSQQRFPSLAEMRLRFTSTNEQPIVQYGFLCNKFCALFMQTVVCSLCTHVSCDSLQMRDSADLVDKFGASSSKDLVLEINVESLLNVESFTVNIVKPHLYLIHCI